MNNIKNKLEKIVKVQEDYPLTKLTTWQIGGLAKYFCQIKTIDALQAILRIVQEEKIPHLLIGGGSNLLFDDSGYDGLIIQLAFKQFKFEGQKAIVSADIVLNNLVTETAKRGLRGLSGLISIPGTVGGAIVGNAGAYGNEIGRVVKAVTCLDQGMIKRINHEQCRFNYRDSIFKSNHSIVLSAEFEFTDSTKEVEEQEIAKYRAERLKKIPLEPSAGCVFKNVITDKQMIDRIRTKGYDLPTQFIEYQKIPAAWLIDQINMKGQKFGGAQVSEQHANFIINTGQATAADTIGLISLIKQKIRTEFNIQLQEEIRYINDKI
ncbi:MAG: UDP-N-acetylmuramate dehydrogenase [Candidatus Komeilibacteria bacterium]